MESRYQGAFAETETLCTTLKIIYSICLLVLVFAIFSDIAELGLIQTVMDGGEISDAAATASDNRQGIIGLIQLPLWISAFVIFLVWYYRSYKNLGYLRGHQNEYSNKMVIGNFFIPIVNLYRPYKSTTEMWSQSKPGERDDKGQPVFDTKFGLISAWWALYLVQNFAGQFLFRTIFREQTLDGIYMTSIVTLGSDILDIPLFIVELLIVMQITRWQYAEKKRLQYSYTS